MAALRTYTPVPGRGNASGEVRQRYSVDAVDSVKRNRWIKNLQQLYGVDKDEAASVLDDVLKVMTVAR